MKQAVFERVDGGLVFADGLAAPEVTTAVDVPTLLARLGVTHPLIVSGGGLARSGLVKEFERRSMPYVHFYGFTPNPTAEEVLAGLVAYRSQNCDGILSIGGGSAMDTAKAIKAMGCTPDHLSLLERLTHPQPMAAPHVALPTTAGTGSESTHFATIYIDGKKYSVADVALLPEAAILDASQLATLSPYERSATFLDALCHGIESFWSVRADDTSRAFAAQAMALLTANADAYLAGDASVAPAVMAASNLAGRAINLTTTTAAHAMCYKLTGLYGLPHGHAAAVCLPAAWRKLLAASAEDAALAESMQALAEALGAETAAEGLAVFERLVDLAQLPQAWRPQDEGVLDELAASVNVQRLSNFPLTLITADLAAMYRCALWPEKMP